jgi:hypothetical protein
MIMHLHPLFIFTLFFLLILFLIPLNAEMGYSQTLTSAFNETSVRATTVLKDSYELPSFGFSITFPQGWSGVKYGFIAMVSPNGINLLNGNLKGDQNKALMVIEVLNISDFQEYKNGSGIQKNCEIQSEKIFTIGAAQSKEVYINCGAGGDQKIINYIFGSVKKIFIIGLKGTGDSFENNLDAFRNSVRTVIIKNPIEIEQIPSISSQN